MTPHFNDGPATHLTDAQRRERHARSSRRAAITNRARFREQAQVSTAPPAPAPMPHRVLDPLGSPAQRLIERELARKRQTEQEWRTRLRSVDLKTGPEDGGLKAPRPVRVPEPSDAETAAIVAAELARFNVWRRY